MHMKIELNHQALLQKKSKHFLDLLIPPGKWNYSLLEKISYCILPFHFLTDSFLNDISEDIPQRSKKLIQTSSTQILCQED